MTFGMAPSYQSPIEGRAGSTGNYCEHVRVSAGVSEKQLVLSECQ